MNSIDFFLFQFLSRHTIHVENLQMKYHCTCPFQMHSQHNASLGIHRNMYQRAMHALIYTDQLMCFTFFTSVALFCCSFTVRPYPLLLLSTIFGAHIVTIFFFIHFMDTSLQSITFNFQLCSNEY